ncbi:MAG: ribose-phosphate pyrophosphokinase [Ardenticatenaceae bacterium]|nr:ribose-phosphate pyrophosphokinase [Anaerolineales bacterium]MCB9007174.1 ribose-phosphate pyrophosphokinase [Ardenticatenaceae bacterium]
MTRNLDPHDVRLFSGRSNIPLARNIAQHLDIPLEETRFSKFSNDNLFVQLGASVRGRTVYLVQSMTPPVSDHLVELLMMLDIAKSAAAREIHAIIPYFSYARSDKKDAPRISITARLIADLLRTSGATHVMTMTLHSPQVHGFFSIPADPLTARMTLEQFIRQRPLDPKKDVVVAPDMGRAKPAARFAAGLGLPIASADKTRVSDTEVKIGGLIGRQVEGFEHALVYDDEIATAGSVVELSEVLVESGIKRITLICTHGLFLGPAVERIKSIPQIQEVITTDTVERPSERRPPNLTVLSVGNVFAEAIRQNYLRRSIGELFEGMET